MFSNIDNKMKVQPPSSAINDIKFCYHCGCEDFEHNIIDQMEEGIVSEYELCCKECGAVVNYWCYGHYDNEKSEEYLNQEKNRLRLKKIENIIGE